MIQVSKDTFEQEVIQSDKPVVVDFWGPNCQPCLKLMPQVEELAKRCKDKVKIVKVNSTENRRLCLNLRVMGLPSFLAYKNGQEVSRISGQELTIQDVKKLVEDIA